MDRQLRVDTSHARAHQRHYSFTESQTETTNQYHVQPSSPQVLSHSHPSHQTFEPDHFQTPYAEITHHPQVAVASGHIPHSSSFAQHPANYAPFVDNAHQQDQQSSEVYAQSYVQSPSSPGPLPVKMRPEPLKSPIVPDANPLQSPALSYFPPPTASECPQSPAPIDLMTYHRPGQISHPNSEVKGGTWRHGMCDCSSIGTCCLGLLCPCVLYGKTQYRLSMMSKNKDPTNMLGYETCNGSCAAMAVLCGCQWLLATIQHVRTRKAYAIEGNIASDCVRATCCTCCTLIQDETEIRKREKERENSARISGAILASPYLAPAPMSYGPT